MINKKKWSPIFAIVILSFICLISCSKNVEFTTEQVHFTEDNFSCSNKPCATIDINLLVVEGVAHSHKINQSIDQHLANLVGLEEESYPLYLEKAITLFNKEYRDLKTEFPDELYTYEVTMNCFVNFKSSELLTVEVYYYLFTGGAHGYEGTKFIHYNLENGEEIHPNRLFKNVKKVSKLCENTFRRTYNIPPDENINSTGFNFEKDQFYLPENVGFQGDSILFFYNAYEINPYASGSTQIKLPLEKLKDQFAVDLSK